jgi:phosphate transport system permease protein
MTQQAGPAIPAGPTRPLSQRRPLGDRTFQVIALAAGLLVLVILVLIAISTTQQAAPWFKAEGWGIFGKTWNPASNQFGALAFIYGTAITSAIAVIMAVPVSVGIALLLTEVVPYRWARPIVYVIDLLAVVPSVVWGLWGILVFAPWIAKIYSSIASAVTGIPVLGALFGPPTSGASFFTAGVILAFMITPIVTSLSREVIATVPVIDKEGAYALGATRLEMIQGAVWPHSKGGIVGAVLLGLGRAIGETIAAALVIGSSATITSHLFAPGDSMPAVIANQFGEASGVFRAALMGLGVLGAIYLNEYGGKGVLGRLIGFMADVMTGVPSIVMGLFIFSIWVLHFGFSGFAGALALGCLMLPVVIRSTDEMLKLVPNPLREGSYALGATKSRVTMTVVLPAAIGGIVSGALLAIARAVGETAPLLFTILTVTTVNRNVFSGPNTSLPSQIFANAISPYTGAQDRAWGAALTLIVIAFVLMIVARIVTARFTRYSR